jgi:hypothetical protein
MDYRTFKEIIINSNPEDWLVTEGVKQTFYFNDPTRKEEITCEEDSKTVLVYKGDLNIRIEEETDINKEFHEKWAQDFPDPRAYRVIARLYYGCSLVEEKVFVAVDGFRATLPLPEPPDYKYINYEDYRIARILNWNEALRKSYFDTYIKRFEIKK